MDLLTLLSLKRASDEFTTYMTKLMFAHSETNAQKLSVVFSFLNDSGNIPCKIPVRKKNNKIANKIRQKGNTHFAQKGAHFLKALTLYNKSICMAEIGSEDYAIGFANRSAVYIEMSNPEFCLKDIQTARESGYPQKLMHKLKAREEMCLEMLKKRNENTYQPNNKPVQPLVKPYLIRKENKKFGKYLATSQLINPGDTLIVEDPFTCQLNPKMRYKRCWHCMEENGRCLIPCKQCTQVMFCSTDCLNAAQSSYHSIECQIIDYVLEKVGGLQLLAMRTVIKSVNAFGSLADMVRFIKEHGGSKVDAFSAIDKKGLYKNDDQQKFHQFFSFNTIQDKNSTEELFLSGFVASFLFIVLVGHSTWIDGSRLSKEARNMLLELLYHIAQSTIVHSKSNSAATSEDSFSEGFYPTSNLINHSCSPNVIRVMRQSQQWIIAIRVIKPGEQLFESYGPHCGYYTKIERKLELLKRYIFHCKCEACRNDYPKLENQRDAQIPWAIALNRFKFNRLSESNFIKKIDDLKVYLKKYDRYHPCMQLSIAQEYFKFCVNMHFANYPLEK